ncbi:glycoside hydrolase family 76 protein [Diplodia corticola]|uniref:Glycoside hydrolase family 76 protein n=1 Tax=Diplodia corticola TaxID=236234 RepID=A0A1J9R7R0_9PEZI|nr:glycoside hydrolase family 76 protein [Diplodia corticola]OJD36624.1 glycoside hydrolase family 76 protein [Diplodia corticola]
MHSRLPQSALLQPCHALTFLALLSIALLCAPVNATVDYDTPSLSRDIAEAAANAAQKPFTHPRPASLTPDDDAAPAAAIPPESGGEVHWPLNPLEELHNALETMQSRYFELWLGQWPSAIDWTAAVMSTFVSATLHSLTRSLEYVLPGAERPAVDGQRIENEIGRYFSQSVAYYFGEDAFSLRMQAYDDMLWVVLGWLESIKFIDVHARRHYGHHRDARHGSWYGAQFAPGFAHRAHIFYNIASAGWDTELCGGGMTWNPRLTPYKNAITNQLFISASIGMYLYFPGDDNSSPFMGQSQSAGGSGGGGDDGDGGLPTARPHDARYLAAAVRGYEWLRGSNMTNDQGLYVDGFHITDWGKNGTIGTGKCDERNEMTYTYNQGVLLSGLRGLWEATGERWYLEDGHELVRNVIKATGWAEHEERRRRRQRRHRGRGRGGGGGDGGRHHRPHHSEDEDDDEEVVVELDDERETREDPSKWHGMGRAGVLEEQCDAAASCSQNGQTFKGIFFHHLTLFCEPLPLRARVPGGITHGADPATASLHRQSCKEYATWVAHNARMALRSRDAEGRFGMWWGAAAAANSDGDDDDDIVVEVPPLPVGAVDYRNDEEVLLGGGLWLPIRDYDWSSNNGGGPPKVGDGLPSFMEFGDDDAVVAGGKATGGSVSSSSSSSRLTSSMKVRKSGAEVRDKNDRGRGRTVETQGGGVAVVRALWEFVNMYRE